MCIDIMLNITYVSLEGCPYLQRKRLVKWNISIGGDNSQKRIRNDYQCDLNARTMELSQHNTIQIT